MSAKKDNKMISVRIAREKVEGIQALGYNVSDFTRIAIDEKLEREQSHE